MRKRAGSSPVIRTISSVHNQPEWVEDGHSISFFGFITFHMYGSGWLSCSFCVCNSLFRDSFWKICKEIGERSILVMVRNMTNEEAVIAIVDAILQREKLLPSEKVYAFQMKMDALNRQDTRVDLTSPQVAAKFRTDDTVAASMDISGDTILRHILFPLKTSSISLIQPRSPKSDGYSIFKVSRRITPSLVPTERGALASLNAKNLFKA